MRRDPIKEKADVGTAVKERRQQTVGLTEIRTSPSSPFPVLFSGQSLLNVLIVSESALMNSIH